MKKVLLVTDGIFHPPYFGRMAVYEALRLMEEFSFQHVSSLEKLPTNLNQFSALVIYISNSKSERNVGAIPW
jgi:hypothetical protein